MRQEVKKLGQISRKDGKEESLVEVRLLSESLDLREERRGAPWSAAERRGAPGAGIPISSSDLVGALGAGVESI